MTKQKKFIPRDYQRKIYEVFDSGKYNKAVIALPRGSGKDITAFNTAVRQCLKKKSLVYYVCHYFMVQRNPVWGNFASSVPQSSYEEAKLTFNNGSVLRIVSPSEIGRAVMAAYEDLKKSPDGIVISEPDWVSPDLCRRALVLPHWSLIIGTPFGKRVLYEAYNKGLKRPDTFTYKLTIDDTKHAPLSEIERVRKEGLLSEDDIKRAFYSEFIE